jgi:hypothetical protein
VGGGGDESGSPASGQVSGRRWWAPALVEARRRAGRRWVGAVDGSRQGRSGGQRDGDNCWTSWEHADGNETALPSPRVKIAYLRWPAVGNKLRRLSVGPSDISQYIRRPPKVVGRKRMSNDLVRGRRI